MQRVLQDRHPDPGLPRLVVVLVEEDEVHRDPADAVVSLQSFCQRSQVSVDNLVQGSRVEQSLGRDGGEIMDPQDVIVLGFLYRPQQLPMKLEIGKVPDLVMVGELHAGD